MKTCPNCRCQINDDAAFCPVCGTTVESLPHLSAPYPPIQEEQNTVYTPPEPAYDPYDHTEEFEDADISENKLLCMLIYLLDFIGIIIALLMNKSSQYVQFHIRQAMKLTVIEILLVLIILLLCWTVIVPIAGAAALVVLLIFKFVSFVQVCCGEAKEPVLIRKISFLK